MSEHFFEDAHAVATTRTAAFLHVIEKLYVSLSTFERFLVITATVALLFSTALMLRALNSELTIEVPTRGGSYTEGVIGSLRFVNPVLAVSDTDRALSSLVYSGLLRHVNGEYEPDIAESYTISEDGKVYTFVLKPQARFHDGTPVTADDILYTIDMARNPAIKSPRRAEWEGVRAEKVSDTEVTFTLEKPFAGFIHTTTTGILPKHLWESLTSEEFAFSTNNVRAVGSGPYQFSDISYKNDGIPHTLVLTAFDAYTLGTPYISKITIRMFSNEDEVLASLAGGGIDAYGGVAAEKAILLEDAQSVRSTLPRTFALFFNPQKNPILADTELRRALSELVPHGTITRDILKGHASPLFGPLPTDVRPDTHDLAQLARTQSALTRLAKAGYVKNPETNILSKDGKEVDITLITANTGELSETVRAIAEKWREAGVRVRPEMYESGDLQTEIVRPRAFDVLFFGEVVPSAIDLFAFWHSSQIEDPGLNIAQYSNKEVDRLLDKLRTSTNTEERATLYTTLRHEIEKDAPAAFVYSPLYVYIYPAWVKKVTLADSIEGYERFSSVHTWYIESDRVWPFLIH